VTALLLAWRKGDHAALEQIVPRVHDELQKIARRCMRGERKDHTLQATALLNEAFLRLIDVRQVNWQNRTHFLAMSARIMRRVLVDAARARQYQRRGAGALRVSLDEALLVGEAPDVDVIALSEALDEFAQLDERKSRVVELRYFGGLTVEETAEALSISPVTVARDWRLAKAWLRRKVGGT
jgi:RNA polymerase sigma factor (TIGR02999 family)